MVQYATIIIKVDLRMGSFVTPAIAILVDLLLSVAYSVLCLRGTELGIHAFTNGVALASVSGAMAMGHSAPWNDWDWFSWAKCTSLIVIWLSFFLAWKAALIREDSTWSWLKVPSRRSLQLILMANVGEAAMLMVTQGNLVAGMPCALLAMYAPDWDAIDSNGRLTCREEATVLGWSPVSMTARTYTRAYYIILSFCLCTHPRFKDFWVFVYVTCLWPLLLQEALPSVNVGTVFKVRVFMLVAGAMLATFVDTEVLTYSTLLSFDLPLDDWISLNLFSAAILLTSCVFFWGLGTAWWHGRRWVADHQGK